MKKNPKRLSLYPMKFDEVIPDVLKVRPEPKHSKPKRKKASKKAEPRATG